MRDWEIWTKEKVKALEKRWAETYDERYALFNSLLPEYNSVLDVGCGIGIWYPLLTNNGAEYKGIDTSDAMIERARELYNGDFEHGDIFDFDGNYDFVFCVDVLYNIPNFDIAMKQLVKHSKTLMISMYVGKMKTVRGGWNEIISKVPEEDILELLSPKKIIKSKLYYENDFGKHMIYLAK